MLKRNYNLEILRLKATVRNLRSQLCETPTSCEKTHKRVKKHLQKSIDELQEALLVKRQYDTKVSKK